MHVLVTRPRADARDLTTRLEGTGCRVSLAPLLEIAFEPIAAGDIDGAAGLIATSGNAISALKASPALPIAAKLPLFAVGAATADRAHDAGFQTIIAGPGTAAELKSVIAASPVAKSGRLIHLAGDRLAFDLAGALASAGVTVKTVMAYRSHSATELPAQVMADLEARVLDAVILMSPRTAKTWRTLVQSNGRSFDLSGLTHVCLSDAVAGALGDARWQPRLAVAPAPTVEEIVAVVRQLASRTASR
ncbi:MAG: uroporphyrinogen-III synthase [Hyphomicrobium sp.]